MNLPTLDQCSIRVEALEEDTHWTDSHNDFDPGVRESFAEMVDQHGLWGWCMVKVTVVDPTGLLSAEVYLGGCSYKDEGDFRANSGYFDDMCEEALEAVHKQIETIFNRYS